MRWCPASHRAWDDSAPSLFSGLDHALPTPVPSWLCRQSTAGPKPCPSAAETLDDCAGEHTRPHTVSKKAARSPGTASYPTGPACRVDGPDMGHTLGHNKPIRFESIGVINQQPKMAKARTGLTILCGPPWVTWRVNSWLKHPSRLAIWSGGYITAGPVDQCGANRERTPDVQQPLLSSRPDRSAPCRPDDLRDWKLSALATLPEGCSGYL